MVKVDMMLVGVRGLTDTVTVDSLWQPLRVKTQREEHLKSFISFESDVCAFV